MTHSERVHRNARMILEAAGVRRRGYRSWRFGCSLDLCWDYWGQRWAVRASGWAFEDDSARETAKVILRGILAPRLLAELREQAEDLARRVREEE